MPNKPLKCILIAAFSLIVVCLDACSPKHASYSDYLTLPDDGWAQNSPLYFTPEWGDSSQRYDITLVVRHTTAYPYSSLNLTVDLIPPHGQAKRSRVTFELTDGIGNWTGHGFGNYYQCSTMVARGVGWHQVSRVAVWNTMQGADVLKGVENVGIIVSPSNK